MIAIGAAPCAASYGMSPDLTITAQDFDEYLPQTAYNPDRGEYLIVYTLMNGNQGDIWAVKMNAGGSILGDGFESGDWGLWSSASP
jgi:hypothetical protein